MKGDRRFAELLDRHLDQRLEGAERRELEHLLVANPEYRREFWKRAETEGLLQEWGRTQEGVDHTAREAAGLPRPGWWRRHRSALATGIAAAVALSAVLWLRHDSSPATSPDSSTAAAVAMLTLESEARWRPGSTIPKAGQFMGAGDLELESGWALLQFGSGSELIIGGPAQVHLSGPNEISCKTGDLTIHQPTWSATFVVHTPAGVVQDIHQTVSLRVRPEATDLRVEENGRGALRSEDDTSALIPTGELVRMAPGGTFTKTPGLQDDFARQLRHASDLRAAARAIPGQWLATSKRLNEHPDLVLRYTFDDIPPDLLRVPNQALHSVTGLDGTIGGGQLTSGRWPYKKALELDRRFDGVRVSVPGSYREVTMAAWIQVRGYENRFNGLFMSDGLKPGGFHWQILNTGALHLGIIGTPSKTRYTSPAVLTPDTFGTWQHVAVVFDLPGKHVSFYCNGRLLSRDLLKDSSPIQMGSAMIGNWDPLYDKDGDMIRNFKGRMDDFSIYRRVLSDSEIQQLFEQGRAAEQR